MNLEIYYRNAIENTFFSAFYLAQDLTRVVTCSQQPLAGTCSRGRDKSGATRGAVASPIIKRWTGHSEMSNPRLLCEVLVYNPLPEVTHSWPLPHMDFCRWTFIRCVIFYSTLSRQPLSMWWESYRDSTAFVFLPAESQPRWDFTRITELVPKMPFNGNTFKVYFI